MLGPAARRADRLAALAAELPGSLATSVDLTVDDDVARLVGEARAAYGRVDVVVNNAGQGLHVPVAELRLDDLRAVLELNVLAPLALMQAVLPMMRHQGAGSIVNVSSATTLRRMPGVGGYAATKAALNILSDTARMELAESGIAVSLVYPSLTATEFHQRLRAGSLADGARRVAPDPPELAAEAVLFAIEHGDAHVTVADPPRPITPQALREDRHL